MSDRPPAPQRLPFTVAAGAVFTGILVVAILFINRANSPNTPLAATTPSPTALQPPAVSTPAPTPNTVPYADCSTQTFGAPLAPLNEPSDPHVYSAPPPMTIDTTKLYEVTITTARGSIVLCLQPNLAPVTVNNFVTLARNHFYDGLKFHRVVPGFVIQGGDPKGDGTGGPGYSFADEPVKQAYVAGAVAMANSGPNSNGSQFFICTVDDTASLQPSYNLFGKVASGMNVVTAIQQGDVMTSVTVAQSQ
ncbi:MAG: peptidylprolyl isomerase [Candidatus Dormibacteria bacterium]